MYLEKQTCPLTEVVEVSLCGSILRRMIIPPARIQTPHWLVMLPGMLSLLTVFLVHGFAQMETARSLSGLNLPLIAVDDFAAREDQIVVTQKYFNRVQIYDHEARFVSGFPLRGTSSGFAMAIDQDGRIVDCTPIGSEPTMFDIYSAHGVRERVEITAQILKLCEEAPTQTTLSDGSEVSIKRNILGFTLLVESSEGPLSFRSPQPAVPYVIAKLLYMPVAFSISLALLASNLFLFFLRGRKGSIGNP